MLYGFLFKTIAVVLPIFLVISFVVSLAAVEVSSKQTVAFDVKKGDGFKDVSRQLKEAGLIKSETWFKIYSLVTGSAHLFKPGIYNLSRRFSLPQIVRLLMAGPEDIKVTIQEGETLVDIDRKLSLAKVIEPEALIDFNKLQSRSQEGFLFPDTYNFAPASPIEKVVEKFLNNFQEKVGEADYQDLIMASLIEKEAIHSQDRLLVAGVFKKRLAIGMPLQVDATIVYAKCRGAFLTCDDDTRKLSRQDLKMNNPYNTYTNKNLPPTPIANPGKSALMAARNPQSSKYLYYISDPKTGRIIFARTLDEHNENRLEYLK